MQKRLGSGFEIPQTNVSRVGRKIMLTGGVDEASIHEIMKLLFEIENEDNETGYQGNAEVALNGIANVLETETEELTKDEEKNLINIVNNYKRTIHKPTCYDREPIELYISSYGGDGYEVLGVIDVIRNMKAPVYTYLYGKAMSAGFLMFMVGDKRFISRNSTLMIHQLSGGMFGTIQDMREQLEEYERMQEQVEDLIMLHTHLNEEDLEGVRFGKYDLYLNAEEAKDFGIADEII